MGRGGRRPGAGAHKKPEKDLTQMVSFRLARRVIGAIKALSVSLGVSQAKVIERAVLLFEASQLEEGENADTDSPETPS